MRYHSAASHANVPRRPTSNSDGTQLASSPVAEHKTTIAAAQMCAGPDKAANLAIAGRLATEAASRGAQLVVLPEVFAWSGPQAEEPSVAETIPGPTCEAIGALATRLGIYVVAGSILERAGDDKVFNTCVLLGPDGAIRATYRKIHLFDVDLPGRVTVRESDTRQPGDAPVVAETSVGKLGLSICYDLRFPELYRHLAHRGASLLVVPAAFTTPTGSAHWEVLLRARAIENQSYVIAANQYGPGLGGTTNYGNSMIIDPWGTVLARAGDREAIVLADIDSEYLNRVREELPALRHAHLRQG